MPLERPYSKCILPISKSRFQLFPFRKKVLRGTLTNGHEWMFILLKFNDGYEGATYRHSDVVGLYDQLTIDSDPINVIPEPSADVIAGILLYWVSTTRYFKYPCMC
jgi:hypothetical protein